MDDLIQGFRPPNESRGFIHKRIGRGLKTFVTSGFNPIAAAGAFVSGGGGCPSGMVRVAGPGPGEPRGVVRTRSTAVSLAAPPTRCLPGVRPHPVTGKCTAFLGDRPGPDSRPLQIGPGTAVGAAVMGRFGAALEPGSRIIDRAVCLRGMVLAVDGLCYNRSQIKNSERMWPRGRRPLLTGGEYRAISIASRAASRLTRTAQRLQEMGLIQKPVVKRRRKK